MDAGVQDHHEDATVLVVEDDPTLRSTLAFNLTREGYKVLAARTGPDALDVVHARGDELSLILLDVMLPGLGGLHVLREVRRTSDVPVLMVSAKGEEQDKVDGLELGADDYVVKPFSLRELLARVRATVRRRAVPAARPPRVLTRGEIEIEPERRRVTVDGEDMHLRPKEFGLLVTLAMEPGRVFGRQDLLDLVWGDDVVVDERTVDVHISWLRGKLQDAGVEHATIRTVYGAGYRFEVTRHNGEDSAMLPASPFASQPSSRQERTGQVSPDVGSAIPAVGGGEGPRRISNVESGEPQA